MSATEVLPAPPIVTCMDCGANASEALGWLIVGTSTISGGLIAVRLCFDCRGLAAWPVPDCGVGSSVLPEPVSICGVVLPHVLPILDVWTAFCGSCEGGWSCWDRHCVRAWEDEHYVGCDIRIHPPRARELR